MLYGNAEGKLLPPYLVYKSKWMWNSWIVGRAPGCRYNKSISFFRRFFSLSFLPAVKTQQGTKILIGDNLSSHLNLNVRKILYKVHLLTYQFITLCTTVVSCILPSNKRSLEKCLTRLQNENQLFSNT